MLHENSEAGDFSGGFAGDMTINITGVVILIYFHLIAIHGSERMEPFDNIAHSLTSPKGTGTAVPSRPLAPRAISGGGGPREMQRRGFVKGSFTLGL